MSGRILALAVFALAACRDPGLSGVEEGVSVPAQLDLGTAYVGHPRRLALPVTNRGRAAVTVRASAPAPFSVDAEVTVPGGGAAELFVGFAPAAPGAQTATLELEPGGPVALTGEGRAVPDCAAASACSTARFDPEQGCVQEEVSDGSACSAACLTQGQCLHGVCMGTAVSCDDQSACTADACTAEEGCLHAPVQCPKPSDPCQVAACDPVTGCGSVAADDGTSCGANDCRTAHVCMAGQCVERPSPEGSQCAEAGTCRAASRCEQGACVAPPAQVPAPRWVYANPPNRGFGSVTSDSAGTVYALVTELVRYDGGAGAYDLDLISLDRYGRLRFSVPLSQQTPGLENGVRLIADAASSRVYLAARTYNFGTVVQQRRAVVEARDSTTGALVWQHDLVRDVPVLNSSNGQPMLDIHLLALLPNGDVAVSLTEGETLHVSYVIALSHATGAETWRVVRSGHLGTPGVSATGELWEVSAPCWSSDSRLSRLSADGGELLRLPSSAQLTGFESDRAVAFTFAGSNTAMQLLSPAQVSTPVTLPAGHATDGWMSEVRSLDGELTFVTKDLAHRWVSRWDPALGIAWSTPISAPGDLLSLRLVRDGGTAVSVSPADGGSSELVTLSANGAELDRCPFGAVSGLSIVNGIYVTSSTATSALVAFDVPGLDTERRGWPSASGVGGTYRAR